MPETLLRKGSLLLVHGLDVSSPAEYISDQASPNVLNFIVSRNLLKKRTGTTLKGSSFSEEIMNGREFTREGVKYNVAIGLTKIKYFTGGAWSDITGIDLTGDSDDLVDTAVAMLSGKRILCFTNGVDAIRKWLASGNTADLGGTPPKAKFIEEYKTYLVCANITGGTDIAQRVQWSDTADPETWGSGNAGSKDLVEDGEDITGMKIFGDYLAVHKESSIYLGYLVSTTAIFKFDRKSTGSGTVANNSIQNLPTGEQFFLASDGLRVFNGIAAPLIDSPVNDEIRDFLNQQYRHKAWSVLVKENDEVWAGLPIGSQVLGETVYKFNYKTRVLYKDSRSAATSAWRASLTAGVTWDDISGTWDEQSGRWNDGTTVQEFPQIHIGNSDGTIVVVDENAQDDNGTAINAQWESKDFETDAKGYLGRWQEIDIWARGSGSLLVEYSTDEGECWSSIGTFTLGNTFPADASPFIGYLDVLSTKIRFRFTHSDSSGYVEIKQFLIGYVQREYRG